MFDGTVEEEDGPPIPTGWTRATLGDVVPSPRPKIDATPDSTLPFVGMEHIDAHSFALNGQDELRNFKSAASHFLPGDVLYGRLRPYLNKVHKARFEGAASAEFIVLTANERIDTDFLRFLLHQMRFVQFANERSSGDRPRVKFDDIAEFEFGLPPLADQRRIVSRIEELFSQVEAGERAIGDARRDLARYRRSVLHAAVTGALTEDWREANPEPAEDGPALLARLAGERRAAWERAELVKLDAKGKPRPKTDKQWATFRGRYKAPDPTSDGAPVSSWVVATIDSLTQSFSNGLSRKPADHETEYPILRISAVRRMSVATDDVRFYEPRASEKIDVAWVQANDLLFTRYNGSAELVGVCGRFKSSAPVLHPDKLMKAVPIGRDAALSRWLEIAANAGMTAARIGDWVKTSAGQHGIAGSDVKAAPVPLPPAAEQAEIVSRIDEAFSRADAAEATLDAQALAARALKQSILKAAFAGQLA